MNQPLLRNHQVHNPAKCGTRGTTAATDRIAGTTTVWHSGVSLTGAGEVQCGSSWMGDSLVHLRLCRTCGHVGCCDDSKNKHATKHFHATRHPIIEGYDPPEGWGVCYVDEIFLDLGDNTTPQLGPIPRYV